MYVYIFKYIYIYNVFTCMLSMVLRGAEKNVTGIHIENPYVYVCICIYICTYICVYTYIYIFVCCVCVCAGIPHIFKYDLLREWARRERPRGGCEMISVRTKSVWKVKRSRTSKTEGEEMPITKHVP